MIHSRTTVFALLLAAATLCASCAGVGLNQSLDSQLGEVRSLRSELESQWKSLGSMVSSVENQVSAFSGRSFDLSSFDYSLVGDAITSAVDPVLEGEVGVVEASTKAQSELEDALGSADAETRAEVGSVYNAGTQIYSQLKTGLPSAIQDLLSKAGSAVTQLAQLRAESEGTLAVAEKNPLMQGAQLQNLKNDQAALERELTQVENFAGEITDESGNYSERVLSALGKFSSQLESLGGSN